MRKLQETILSRGVIYLGKKQVREVGSYLEVLRMAIRVLSLLLLWNFCGCSSTYTSKNYLSAGSGEGTLYIAPLSRYRLVVEMPKKNGEGVQYAVRYHNEILRNFNRAYLNQMKTGLKSYQNVTSHLSDPELEQMWLDTNFQLVELKYDGDPYTYTFYVPRKETLKFMGIGARLALFLSEVRFENMRVPIPKPIKTDTTADVIPSENPYGDAGETKPSNLRSLECHFRYILWDYTKNTAVAFGDITVRLPPLVPFFDNLWAAYAKEVAAHIRFYSGLHSDGRWSQYW